MDLGNLQVRVNRGGNLEQGIFPSQYFEKGPEISDNILAHLCVLLKNMLFVNSVHPREELSPAFLTSVHAPGWPGLLAIKQKLDESRIKITIVGPNLAKNVFPGAWFN